MQIPDGHPLPVSLRRRPGSRRRRCAACWPSMVWPRGWRMWIGSRSRMPSRAKAASRSPAALRSPVRLALTDLGTTFIKLGQMLSTRPDLIGQALATELSKLQASTPPDPPEAVIRMVESELGRPVGECFRQFDGVAHGVGVDRAGASCQAEDGPTGRRQSAASRHRRDHPPRPGYPAVSWRKSRRRTTQLRRYQPVS